MLRTKYIIILACFSILKSFSQSNIGFEFGNLLGWNANSFQNVTSIPLQTCCISSQTHVAVLGPAQDPNINNNFITTPFWGNSFARINPLQKTGKQVTSLTHDISVSSFNSTLRIALRPFLEKASHTCSLQPFVHVIIADTTGTMIVFDKMIQANENNGPCFTSENLTLSNSNYYYSTLWYIYCVNLGALTGSKARVQVIASECSNGDHGGYTYVDLETTTGPTPIPIVSVNNNTFVLSASSSTLTFCNSNSATVIAPPSNSSYTWTGTGINGLQSASATINQPGIYNLKFNIPSGNMGCLSNPMNVQVKLGSPQLTVSIGQTTACTTSTFPVNVSGAPIYSISTSAGYTINNMASIFYLSLLSGSTTYSITGYDVYGCSDTYTTFISTVQIPTLSVSGNTFCAGTPGSEIV